MSESRAPSGIADRMHGQLSGIAVVRFGLMSVHAYACITLGPESLVVALPRYGDYDFWVRRCFAHRACAARRSVSLRSSGLTLRHRAAPKPTACRFIGGGESFRLATSSISSARSTKTSGGSPLCFMIRRSVIVRLTPSAVARSVGIGVCIAGLVLGVDMRLLVLVEGL